VPTFELPLRGNPADLPLRGTSADLPLRGNLQIEQLAN